jgi:hypothetical protein
VFAQILLNAKHKKRAVSPGKTTGRGETINIKNLSLKLSADIKEGLVTKNNHSVKI